MSKFAFVLLGVSLWVGSAQARADSGLLKSVKPNSAIEDLQTDCRTTELDMYTTCVQVRKYSYRGSLKPEAVKAAISESGFFSGSDLVMSKDTRLADKILRKRLTAYANTMAEFIANTGPYDEGTEHIETIYKTYRKYNDAILSIMKRQANARGNVMYLDEDTYWAPSVNASAVWVFNPTKRTIYQFILGDLDG